MITIQKSSSGAYFTIQDNKDGSGVPGGLLRTYGVNQYDFVPDPDGVSFSLESVFSRTPDRFKPIDKQPFTNITNGDTSAVFASFAALQTYVQTYFFRNPNATPGGGVPAGSDKYIQYNNAGAFGGDSAFQYLSSTHTVTLSAISDTSKSITWLGDSVISGFGLSAGVRYSSQVCAALGYIEDNRGVVSSAVHTAGTSLIPTYSAGTMAYLMIAYGINDLYTLASSASTFQTDLTGFVNGALAKGWPANNIYLISMYGYLAQFNNTQNLLYNTAMQNVCTSLGTNYADLYTPMQTGLYGVAGNASLTQGDYHPNALGSKALFQMLGSYLSPKYNITNQAIVAGAPIEGTGLKLRNYNYLSTGSLLGSAPDGTISPLLGLPDGIRALGQFYLKNGLLQDGADITLGDTTKDILLRGNTTIYSNAGGNHLNGYLQLFNSSTGYTTLTNTYQTGLINFIINGSTTLVSNYDGTLAIGGNFALNNVSSYINQTVGGNIYGRLQLMDSAGITYLRNSYSNGYFLWYMSGGVDGAQVLMADMTSNGHMILQAGGTYVNVPSSRFTVNSTTEGALPYPRMTTTQRTSISSPEEGIGVYDLTLHKLYIYDGTLWQAAW